MGFFEATFGPGNGGDQDFDVNNLPKTQRAAHYAREADKATGQGNGQKR